MLKRPSLAGALAAVLVTASTPASAAPRHHGARPLLAVANQYLGRGNFTGFKEAWCADAVNVWLRLSHHRPIESHAAISFARYGRPSAPAPGVLAVMRHHVGIVVRMTALGPLVLSGNHHHRVGLSVIPARAVVAYREPV